MLSSKNCHMFLKKCALSLAILNIFYSYVFIREPLARHSSLWRCEIVRAGSSRMSLASEETLPRCYLLLLVSAYTECSSWIFRKRHREKFSGLTINRRICEGAKHDMCQEERKKKNVQTEYGNAARVMEILQHFRCLSFVEISAPPSVWYSARTPARNSISGRPRNVEVTQRNGNISRITVGWGTLGISRETPCLEHVPDEII